MYKCVYMPFPSGHCWYLRTYQDLTKINKILHKLVFVINFPHEDIIEYVTLLELFLKFT